MSEPTEGEWRSGLLMVFFILLLLYSAWSHVEQEDDINRLETQIAGMQGSTPEPGP